MNDPLSLMKIKLIDTNESELDAWEGYLIPAWLDCLKHRNVRNPYYLQNGEHGGRWVVPCGESLYDEIWKCLLNEPCRSHLLRERFF